MKPKLKNFSIFIIDPETKHEYFWTTVSAVDLTAAGWSVIAAVPGTHFVVKKER